MTKDDDKPLIPNLRKALNHLYDPADLRSNPLQNLLGLGSKRDGATVLRQVLSEAITALKPEKSIPVDANAWRIYRVLIQRFIEQSSQAEVARNIGLGIRQFRRLEAQAIGVLADYLRAHNNFNHSSNALDIQSDESGTSGREAELAWLQESLPNQPVDVVDLIQAAVLLVSPLAESNQVHLVIDARKDLPLAIGQTTTFRQVLVTVLSTAVRSAIGGRVIISAEVKGRSVDCRIRPVSRSFQPTSLPYEENDNLEIARRLIEILGGTCQVQIPGEDHNSFDVHLALPIIEGAAILVVDDNIDTLQLLQRYTVGSRYRFIGLRDPQEVMRVAQELLPQIIVLDVMLPHIDGWELMGRLLEHPVTRHIPVLICSILPHEHLAATMGAAGFIRKPVTRRAFLKALDDHLVN